MWDVGDGAVSAHSEATIALTGVHYGVGPAWATCIPRASDSLPS